MSNLSPSCLLLLVKNQVFTTFFVFWFYLCKMHIWSFTKSSFFPFQLRNIEKKKKHVMESIAPYPDLRIYTEKEISENIIECIQLAKEKRLRIGGHNQHPV